MKKAEKRFLIFILAAAVLLCAGFYFLRSGHSERIRITAAGKEVGVFSLAENQVIPIGDTNVCEISEGQARMIEAHCPDQLCIRQKPIDAAGGTIVCLPNQVVIEGLRR